MSEHESDTPGGEGPARAQQVRTTVRRRRAALQTLHDGGASGSAVVRQWVEDLDGVVCGLFDQLRRDGVGGAAAVALIALGDYGRGELSPYSKLDLLLLHREAADLGPLTEGLLYPLWDARLEVQGVARSLEENVRVAINDQRSRTNLLVSRWLCGDAELAEQFEQQVVTAERLGRGVGDYLRASVEDMEARHARYGHTVYLLEPHVQEGEGGLRDIQAALDIARARFGVRTPAGLVQKGLVPASEVAALEQSRDFLLRLRNHLHLLSGHRQDHLSFELQDDTAEFFGYRDGSRALGAEQLLQRYYACANQVGHIARSVIRRALAGRAEQVPAAGEGTEWAPGIRVQGGEIQLRPEAVAAEPLTLLGVFEAAQAKHAELSPQALETVRSHLDLVDDRFRRDPEAVRRFLNILQAPRHVASTLMAMHDVRFLDRFIPEMARVFGLVRRDSYHAYPVDVHSLFAVQELRRLARGEYAEQFPDYTRVMGELQRPHILYLATLLHDVGKGEGHDHEQRGAELSIQVADRMDLEPGDRDYLEFLVRQHVLLAHTAQNRDLHDDELVQDFAAQVGDLEALKMLHLLSFADARAVGPGVWTEWKHTLFGELFEKARQVLEGGAVARADTASRAQTVAERLRAAARELASPAEVEAFVRGVDHPRYLTANSLAVLLRHLTLFTGRAQPPRIELRAVPDEGHTEVLLLARDRPGLFVEIAGLMAAHGINILSAVLNTRRDGWVLDVFHVSLPSGEPMDRGPRWEDWRSDVLTVLRGERSLREALGTRLQARPALQRPRPRIAPRVSVDNAISRQYTVVDVTAGDRLGILYQLSRALAENGLTIRLAKIVTTLHRVSDTFYVETVDGGKLCAGEAVQHLREVLEGVAGDANEEGCGA